MLCTWLLYKYDCQLIKYSILTHTTFQRCRQTDVKLKSPLETRQKTLHTLAASCVQSLQSFASTLPEQLFELKNDDASKKSENLRDTCPCLVLSINTKHGSIQSHKTVPLKVPKCEIFDLLDFQQFLTLSYHIKKSCFRFVFWSTWMCQNSFFYFQLFSLVKTTWVS
jgi:hypothetical protein